MKKTKKIVALVLAAVMLVCTTVAATVAYLTSQTEVVENTFTVGNVVITLDEKDVDNDSNSSDVTTPGRDLANEYHLLPGHEYVKDPTVHVDAESENCFVFVKVVSAIDSTIEATSNEKMDDGEYYKTITMQMEELGWKRSGVENVYYYDGTLKNAEGSISAGTNLVVFNEFMVSGTVDNTTLATYETENDPTKVITVDAYAIQAYGFANAMAAWEAAPLAAWLA